MLVYCDDPSHCAEPPGLFLRGAPVVGDGVFVVDTAPTRMLWRAIALPPARFVPEEVREPLLGQSKGKWSPRCGRCGQRGGRWKIAERDALLAELAAHGVTGVSLRALDLIKHRRT